MKKILFLSLMLACLFSFGKCCRKKKGCTKNVSTETSAVKSDTDEVWMQYNETKCANPWQFSWFQKPTAEQVLGAIEGNLKGKQIDILEIRSMAEKDFISCDACTCPNGNHIYVRVRQSEAGKLKELNFFEIKEMPALKTNDTTR